MARALVVGGGIFGVTAALELRARGLEVMLVDPGPIPHPLAESTDITKVIRADYGSDALYTRLMERSLEGWRDWSQPGGPAAALFHECGVLFVTRRAMEPGGFEHDSFHMLRSRGHRLERVDGLVLAERFPQWNTAVYVDGYFSPLGGYAESGKVVAALARLARDRGVAIHDGVRIVSEKTVGGLTQSVRTSEGRDLSADLFVFAVGAWAGGLLPDLAAAGCFRATGHPVLHLTPSRMDNYAEARFPVFGADISRTGLYGFPAVGGVVKVASHGPGRIVDPSSATERRVSPEEEALVRAPLAEALPELAEAAITSTRICVYGDTFDGDLWIARDPAIPNRIVATGGSGHAFKFAPILGGLIADACEGLVEPRFRWRPEARRDARSNDAARHVDAPSASDRLARPAD